MIAAARREAPAKPRFRPGSRVRVGSIVGRVRWVEGGRAGVVFPWGPNGVSTYYAEVAGRRLRPADREKGGGR